MPLLFGAKVMRDVVDIADWLCLSLLPGLGPVGGLRLLERFGSPGRVLSCTGRELAGVASLKTSQLAGFSRLDEVRKLAADQLRAVAGLGVELIPITDERYPPLLKEIPDPPLILYALGDTGLMSTPAVAMVGSRSATTYGRRAAHSLAGQLTTHGVTVVSGMALGIDSLAHQGALEKGGKTVAVLGCGLDVLYPPQNKQLREGIREHGLLLSEYPLGTRPDGYRFPARNRIIAGMSLGVVVVEAARRSGSLITAQLALDFGREVFAVPGQIDSVKSEGTHWLLRQGAKVVVDAEDIVGEVRVHLHISRDESPIPGAKGAELDPDAAGLFALLEPYPLSRDEVSSRSGLSAARLSELFLYLELEGLIEMTPGDHVRRLIP